MKIKQKNPPFWSFLQTRRPPLWKLSVLCACHVASTSPPRSFLYQVPTIFLISDAKRREGKYVMHRDTYCPGAHTPMSVAPFLTFLLSFDDLCFSPFHSHAFSEEFLNFHLASLLLKPLLKVFVAFFSVFMRTT